MQSLIYSLETEYQNILVSEIFKDYDFEPQGKIISYLELPKRFFEIEVVTGNDGNVLRSFLLFTNYKIIFKIFEDGKIFFLKHSYKNLLCAIVSSTIKSAKLVYFNKSTNKEIESDGMIVCSDKYIYINNL